jgi:hypothetical protein
LHVNCKYRPQLKEDTDLKYLIKKGFLIQQRTPSYRNKSGYLDRYNGNFKNSSKRGTYLIKNLTISKSSVK